MAEPELDGGLYAHEDPLARSKFDEDCVDALLFNVKKVKEIQAQFQDAAAASASGSVTRSNPDGAGA